MRKIVGIIFICISLPLLWFLYDKIAKEINHIQAYDQKFSDSLKLTAHKVQIPALLTDREGNVFSEEYTEWREPYALADIPQFVQDLFLYSEDAHFYDHVGFDLSAIVRAVVVNSSAGSSKQGGSTITQQLVRMRYLEEDKTYERKVVELLYSYELEQKATKDEIFEMYLNEMYFSNGVYGIGGAASYYFQRPLNELTEGEMAFLAAIPNNPSLYDPLTNFENTKARQERLLQTLVTNNVIDAGKAEAMKAQPIKLSVKTKKQQFPAYSTYVLHEFKQLVARNEGFEQKLADAKTKEDRKRVNEELSKRVSELLYSGVTIDTGLSQTKQANEEKAITQELTPPGLQAATVVIDNATREIVSMYAGKNYNKLDYQRAYQAVRQPGSAFKPLIVYAPYFEKTSGSPETMVSGGKFCVGNYCPQNYGGAVYGNVPIRQAFRFSYNTSALRLFKEVGVEQAFSYLKPFRFSSITENDQGYHAALGGLTNGVTPLELADAYTSFIDGQYKPVHAIREVKNAKGEVLYKWEAPTQVVWSPKTVQTMRSLLADVVQNGTGQGIQAPASYLGAKTGTTNEFRDYWIAGLSDKYTAAVWIGYDQPKNMEVLEKARIHHKIFSDIMK